MSDSNKLMIFFQGTTLRRVWYMDTWYYSVVDVLRVLTASKNPQAYWAKLKQRMREEGGEATIAELVQLKLPGADNRLRLTDTANRPTLLRIVQSVPSPNAEPLRQWLAQVGEERIDEIEHPERAVERIRAMYRAKGYDDAWIEQRLRTDMTRNELTDEWQQRGAKEGREYAILTNEINKGTFELTVAAYKSYKDLPARANLRDHMTVLELALLSLGEATAVTLHRDRDSHGLPALQVDARDAGAAAGEARKIVEARTGRPVVSKENFLPAPKKAEEISPAAPEPPPPGEQLSLFDVPDEPKP
ncbi:MAG: hypothetical protein RLZZ387_4121 [Chloroflexota bacterium]|jgi:hypothetical protein